MAFAHSHRRYRILLNFIFLIPKINCRVRTAFALTDYLPSKYKYKTLEFLYRCSGVVIVVAVRIKAALYRKLFPYDFISRKDSYCDKISSKRKYIVSCRYMYRLYIKIWRL